jgi:hypothetical protein
VLAAQPLAEPAERVSGSGRGNLGVDLHRDRDLAVPQDLYRHARVDIEGGQQRLAGLRVPWTVILGTWALARQRSKLRLKFRGSMAVPCRVVNTGRFQPTHRKLTEVNAVTRDSLRQRRRTSYGS